MLQGALRRFCQAIASRSKPHLTCVSLCLPGKLAVKTRRSLHGTRDLTSLLSNARRIPAEELQPSAAALRIEDTITSQETERARDPVGGRDTDRDFTIR